MASVWITHIRSKKGEDRDSSVGGFKLVIKSKHKQNKEHVRKVRSELSRKEKLLVWTNLFGVLRKGEIE
jgi:hypothetical protein